MTADEESALEEKNFLFEFSDRFMMAAGLNKDFPHGRGVYVNE